MTKLYVVGNPVKHSKSPQIHNYWLKKYNKNFSYEKLELSLDKDVFTKQKGFGWESEIDEESYAELVREVAADVNYSVDQAKNERDFDWSDGDFRFDYITFGADISIDKELNARFVNDVISKSLLSKMEKLEGTTYFKGKPVNLFKIERPKLKKKRWWNRR